MALSHELISQFAKIVKDDKKPNTESTVYGTVVTDGNGNKYVKLDGSDQLTPLSDDERPSADSTTTSVNEGERVSVLIKNHTATVTGNISSPAVRTGDFNDLGDQVSEIKQFDIVIAEQVQANEGYIKQLQTDKANVGDLTAAEAKITELETKKASIDQLNAAKAEVTDLVATKIDTEVANAKFATIESLNATNAEITNLEATHGEFETLTTNKFTAIEGSITNLETNKLSATEADLKYANIDFSNIGEAAVEKFYAVSGIIQNLTLETGVVVKELVGVLISGDLIQANTIKAEKLVVRGEDGLYYKLNIDSLGETTASSDEKYQNGLDGSVIIAESITAEKISVSDLVAFGATIGGFKITDNSLYSGVKESVDNTTIGVYIDSNGQMAVGDSVSFIKYYQDTDGTYKLEISAGSIKMSSSDKTIDEEIADVSTKIDEKSEEINQTILGQSTSITSNYEAAIIEALKEYTVSNDFEAFKTTVESQLKLLSDQMTLNFTQTTTDIDNLNKDLNEKFNTITKYFTFDINGLTIGQVDNPYKVIIDNDRYSMTVNDEEVMWISGGLVHTPGISITKTINMFGYTIEQDDSGNVNCGYSGGES